MTDPTRVAQSGILQSSRGLSNSANNIANSETVGFKATSMNFNSLVVSGGSQGQGVGVSSGAVSVNHANGALVPTGNPLHQAISGDGYFVMRDANNELVLSRVGNFGFNEHDMLVDSNGNFVQGFKYGEDTMSPIQIDRSPLPPVVTESGSLTLNFGSDMTEDGDEITTTITVFDSLGKEHEVQIKFSNYELDADNNATWEVHAEVDGQIIDINGGAPNNTIHFNDKGELQMDMGCLDADGNFIIDLGGLGLPGLGEIEMDISESTGYDGESTVSSQTSDGRSFSLYDGYTVEEDGRIVFSYDGGETKEIATIAMASVQNQDGLLMESNGVLRVKTEAGQINFGVSGDMGFGKMYAGYLEGSNVDTTGELIDVMAYQRMFNTNTKVISAAKDNDNALLSAF